MANDDEQNRRAMVEVHSVLEEVFLGCVFAAMESIKVGSPLTGALGQPVDTGNLRNSWQLEFDAPRNPQRAEIGTRVQYAAAVEDAVGPHGPVVYGKSGVGGSHSVKLTVAGFPNIIADVMRRVTERRAR